MAVGDKIQLAFKSEVVALNNTVNNLNTTVNDATTGLAGRVANLEAGGGAGMTPQQVADLAACVTDKHTHANKAVLDGLSTEFVNIVNNLNVTVNEPVNGLTDRVTALEPDKHNHDNKAVLDLITAAFTTAEKTKLGNLTDNFKGLFADAAARNTTVTTPISGNYVLQQDTDTIWYFNGAAWVNTGAATTGDMLKAVYDPTGVEGDVFSMDNMVETETNKILTDIERHKLKLYRGHVNNDAEMLALVAPDSGHFCTRNDTSSVWLYNGTAWNNTNNIEKLIETPTKKVMTDLERDKLALYRGHVADNAAMLALTTPVNGNYCTRGDTKTVWMYVGTSWINTSAASVGPKAGDSKFSYVTADHDGWYSLNGRAVSSLPAAAQAAATALGWASTLPDTRGRLAMAASTTYPSGSNGGNSMIARSNLPLFTLTGNTGNESQSHTHSTGGYMIHGQSTQQEFATNANYPNVACFQGSRLVRSEPGGYIAGNDLSYMTLVGGDLPMDNDSTYHYHNFSVSVPATSSNNASQTHTHAYTTSNINNTGSQTNFIPAHSSKTEFVYLGL